MESIEQNRERLSKMFTPVITEETTTSFTVKGVSTCDGFAVEPKTFTERDMAVAHAHGLNEEFEDFMAKRDIEEHAVAPWKKKVSEILEKYKALSERQAEAVDILRAVVEAHEFGALGDEQAKSAKAFLVKNGFSEAKTKAFALY